MLEGSRCGEVARGVGPASCVSPLGRCERCHLKNELRHLLLATVICAGKRRRGAARGTGRTPPPLLDVGAAPAAGASGP